jgi:hypothetical protein
MLLLLCAVVYALYVVNPVGVHCDLFDADPPIDPNLAYYVHVVTMGVPYPPAVQRPAILVAVTVIASLPFLASGLWVGWRIGLSSATYALPITLIVVLGIQAVDSMDIGYSTHGVEELCIVSVSVTVRYVIGSLVGATIHGNRGSPGQPPE